ncbi:MAG: alkaline phosphatase family protein, partial [Gemmatimonadales bacterium]
RTYLPQLSSVRIGRVRRVLRLGRLRLPLAKPEMRLLRKSRPFWSVLGARGFWSTVLRVPITFPPDRFYGAQLAAMCVPDIQGTQGTFTLFTTRRSAEGFKEGGARVLLDSDGETDGAGRHFETAFQGPDNELVDGSPPLTLPVAIDLDRQSGTARIEVNGRMLELAVGELSDWIELSFKAAPGIKVRGICRMMVTEMGEHFSLYATPINIDPEKPAMPISHPSYYAVYLAKKLGKYATLGLAEDTWALNEGVIDDQTFLRLTYDIDREREEMFFAALDKLRRGTVVCVFDATDRIQHMFWRYLEPDHPAAKNGAKAPSRDAIAELYEHNDALVGRIRARLGAEDVLMVLSDHGFASFRRGLNLNAWLHANGYLALKEGGDGSEEWLRDVDWSRTRAYALGLTGLFLNVEGREAKGIVKSGEEAEALKAELIGRLSGLIDEQSGETAIQEAFDTASLYSGPYLKNGPDVLIGYNVGYRISWDGATGVVEGPIFTDNVKPWSGDHGIDPRLVPGVFFSDRSIGCDDPALIDVAPSALWLFGIQPPSYMDGKVLFTEDFTAVAKER